MRPWVIRGLAMAVLHAAASTAVAKVEVFQPTGATVIQAVAIAVLVGAASVGLPQPRIDRAPQRGRADKHRDGDGLDHGRAGRLEDLDLRDRGRGGRVQNGHGQAANQPGAHRRSVTPRTPYRPGVSSALKATMSALNANAWNLLCRVSPWSVDLVGA
jgi:hypothetical protein